MNFLSSIFPIAVKFFFIANPIGNTPAIVALVKDYSFEQQKKIILREGVIALLIALFFQFFGEYFLNLLNIQDFALTLTGGTILFLVALGMIFNFDHETKKAKTKIEPFIVPIATPIITGPGLMALIMLYSRLENDDIKITSAILLAWVGVLVVLASAPYLQRAVGQRGLIALEQLMGMILAFIATEMFVKGVSMFLLTLQG